MDADTMTYNLTTVVEEGMEMTGVLLFLMALLQYMSRQQGRGFEVGVALYVKETASA